MDELRVVACPHPFRAERIDCSLPAGLSVAEILQRLAPPGALDCCAHVFVDGAPVPLEQRQQLRPRPGQLITVRVVPGVGGGKKNPLAVIMSIALIAATPYLGTLVSGKLGLGLVIGRAGIGVGMALVGIAGQLAIQAIAPPPRQKLADFSAGKDAPSYSLGGGRNRLSPYDVVPQVLGRHLIVPPYGAPPYTELVGQDQYLRMLFVLGYGPLSVEDPKIGESPLFAYSDVQWEVRPGFLDDSPLTLFPSSVTEEVVGATITEAGGWVSRTTQPGVEEIAVELLFPQGLVRFDNLGNRGVAAVEFQARYRPSSGGDWIAIGSEVAVGAPVKIKVVQTAYFLSSDFVWIDKKTGAIQHAAGIGQFPADVYPICYAIRPFDRDLTQGEFYDVRPDILKQFDANSFAPSISGPFEITIAAGRFPTSLATISGAQASALRYGVTARVPAGQYEVQVRRATPDTTSPQLFDIMVWSVLRSVKFADPITLPGLAKIALRIKATDQLNGIVDQFSVVATSICKDWDGSAWVERPTSNPAALARHLLQGPANPKPRSDAELDLVAFEDLAVACSAKGWRFGAVVERETTTAQLLSDVLAAGRASRGKRDGLHTVIREQLQTTPWGHLTPRNAAEFSGEKTFAAIPHALRVRFVNETSWRQDEVLVYDDGYSAANASRFENLDFYGITNADQAWRFGRFHLATARLRPESHSCVTDFEHLVFSRGDLILVTDDVAMHGLGSARIKTVVIDDDPQSEHYNKALGIQIDELLAMETGKTYAVRIRRSDGGSLYRAIVTAEGEHDSLSFAVPVNAIDAPAAGDLLSFGYTDQETAQKIVTRIDMLPDLAARVHYVDAAPAIHSADIGSISPYNPQISHGADITAFAPAAPQILGMVSDDRALIRRADGTIISRILVSFAAGSGGGRTSTIELQFRAAGSTGAWSVVPTVNADAGEVVVDAVEDGVTYDLRLRSLSPYGVPSAWTLAVHTVVGKTSPPPDPDVFLIRVQADGTREFTARVNAPPVDFAGYLIRYRAGTDWTWDDMQPLHDGILTTMPWETNLLSAGDYVFAVRSIDTTGNLSAGAKYIETTIPDPRLAGLLDMYSEFVEGWPGTKTSAFVTAEGYLSALDADTWADKTTWANWTRWNQNPLTPIIYQREHDIGVIVAFIPLVTVQADGTATIEEQHSDDRSTWSAWAAIGPLVTCRYLRVRVTVAGSYPILRDMQTLLSAKPRITDIEDLDTATLTGAQRIGTGDIRLPIPAGFAVIKRVEVTLQNVGAGWSWELIDKNTTTGPRIRIYNGSNTLADAVIDATVRGI